MKLMDQNELIVKSSSTQEIKLKPFYPEVSETRLLDALGVATQRSSF